MSMGLIICISYPQSLAILLGRTAQTEYVSTKLMPSPSTDGLTSFNQGEKGVCTGALQCYHNAHPPLSTLCSRRCGGSYLPAGHYFGWVWLHGGFGCGEIFGWAGRLTLPNPFPPTSQALAEPNGLLAVGGDLHCETLISAYAQGIFPWFEPGQKILWWSPDPRSVLFPDRIHISRSLNKFLRKSTWRISCDTRFTEVVTRCASALRHDDHNAEHSTWISSEMLQAYAALNQLGVAHSIEISDGDQLLGGLYGVMLENVLSPLIAF